MPVLEIVKMLRIPGIRGTRKQILEKLAYLPLSSGAVVELWVD
jgi:hypothetical protein